MFFSNGRTKREQPVEVKLPKVIDTSTEAVEQRYENLKNRAVLVRVQAAREMEALFTVQPSHWRDREAPSAASSEAFDHIMPYAGDVLKNASSDTDEIDAAIRLAVVTILRHTGSRATEFAELLFDFIAFNRYKSEFEDCVTTALDAIGVLSATHSADCADAVARLIDEVDPAEDLNSVYAAFLTVGALGSSEASADTVANWIRRGVNSDHAEVMLASLLALGVLRERFGILKQKEFTEAVSSRAAPSIAASARKEIHSVVSLLDNREVPDIEFSIDNGVSHHLDNVKVHIVGFHHQLVLQAVREFAKSATPWYISRVPFVAEALGLDFADIQVRLATRTSNRREEDYDRNVRTVEREKGRRDARDSKAQHHENDD